MFLSHISCGRIFDFICSTILNHTDSEVEHIDDDLVGRLDWGDVTYKYFRDHFDGYEEVEAWTPEGLWSWDSSHVPTEETINKLLQYLPE